MGVYYYFRNKTRGEANTKPVAKDSKCTHIAKFNWLSPEEMQAAFAYIVESNKWDTSDEIWATADYPGYERMVYKDGKIEFLDPLDYDDECAATHAVMDTLLS